MHADEIETLPLAASLLVIRKDGKILAISRKDNPNKFGLPGGKVDPGETPIEAVVREVREETGMLVVKPFMIFSGVCHGDVTYFNTNFMAKSLTGQLAQQEGEGRLAWVPKELLYLGPFGTYNKALLKHVQLDPRPTPPPVVETSKKRHLEKLLSQVENVE